MKLRKFTTTGLGSLTATVALLAGLSSAHAQAPGGGSYPGSILIPGSNTSFSVGGYAKFDYVYDFSQNQNINGGFSATALAIDGCAACGIGATAILEGAGHAVKGGSQMTASESRFNIQTRTPTGYGEFKTFVEGDFTNPNGLTNSAGLTQNSNSYGFRLRQAYGTLGPFLIGQTFSTFEDLNAVGETLDFGGDIGPSGPTRQPQVRYTYDAGNGLLISGAIENPSFTTEASASAPPAVPLLTGTTFGSANAGGVEQIPDFVGKIEWDQPWGHVAGRAVVRNLNYRTAPNNALAPGFNLNDNTIAWALGFGADVKTWGKDDLTLQVNGGDGGGRYVSSGDEAIPDAIIDGTGTIQTIGALDFVVGYAHWWTDMLRTNIQGGYLHLSQPANNGINFAAPVIAGGIESLGNSFFAQTKNVYTVHANLIWSPIPQIDTGAEFIFGHRTVEAGLAGNLYRMQFSTKFKF